MNRHDDFFSTNASRYDASRPPFLADAARDAMICAARLPSHARVLDIAAGTGRVAIPFASAGYRVVAVDLAAEMLHVLRRKASTARVSAIIAMGAALPFADARFEAVVVARLLYLTPEWRNILRDAVRVLAAGGCLLHEWANGTPDEPSVQIKEHLRGLLEDAGVANPFHNGVRRESDIAYYLSQIGCTFVDDVTVPLDGDMTVGEFIDRIAKGEFSYTWKAPPVIRSQCLDELRQWTSARFDPHVAAFSDRTSLTIFSRHQNSV